MKPYVGIWDALFGKRITLNVPSDNGVKQVQVTEKWFSKMEQDGKFTPVSTETVNVNILDPIGKELHIVENWTIGKHVAKETYDKFIDSETKELYAMRRYKDGKVEVYLTKKEIWISTYKSMQNVG